MRPSFSLGTSFCLLASLVSSHLSITTTPRECQEYTIPVNVSATVFVPNFARIKDNFDVIDFGFSLARRDYKTAFVPFPGTRNVTVSYEISGTICSPVQSAGKNKTLLLATHGLGYDRRYWDSEINTSDYSFVDFAIGRGYSVFFYDRLGTGKSSKVSGFDGAQGTVQLAILQQLTTLLRSGKYTGSLGLPSKIVHIGHSFGSVLSNALVATTPDLSDAAILTGIGYASGDSFGTFVEAWGLRIATLQAPGKWPGRDSEYVTGVDAASHVATFFHQDSYDQEVLRYVEDVKQPLALIELATGGLPQAAPGFTKPTMVISGEFDFAVCGGNCQDNLEHPTREKIFPNATDLQTIVHPKVGHGINFSYNATGAYGVMLDYLNKHGL